MSSGRQIAPLPGSIVCNSIELDSHYTRLNEREIVKNEKRVRMGKAEAIAKVPSKHMRLLLVGLIISLFSLIICNFLSVIIHDDLYLVVQMEK